MTHKGCLGSSNELRKEEHKEKYLILFYHLTRHLHHFQSHLNIDLFPCLLHNQRLFHAAHPEMASKITFT